MEGAEGDATSPRRVLIMTDVGSDIDNVWCSLAFANVQGQGHVRVVGIVTTGGNVPRTLSRELLAGRRRHPPVP
jgi:hypothetical protein